jgi:hypothetical protein
MKALQENQRPRVCVALRLRQGTTELRIQVNWSCRVSAPAATRLFIVLALVLAAAATLAHDTLARDVLYGLAGLLTGARPRTRS